MTACARRLARQPRVRRTKALAARKPFLNIFATPIFDSFISLLLTHRASSVAPVPPRLALPHLARARSLDECDIRIQKIGVSNVHLVIKHDGSGKVCFLPSVFFFCVEEPERMVGLVVCGRSVFVRVVVGLLCRSARCPHSHVRMRAACCVLRAACCVLRAAACHRGRWLPWR